MTPCQATGLKSFLGKDYRKLYCVNLICHGVPFPKVFRKYIREFLKTDDKKWFIEPDIGKIIEKVLRENFSNNLKAKEYKKLNEKYLNENHYEFLNFVQEPKDFKLSKLEKIFTVKNSYTGNKKHKIITILGIKIKYNHTVNHKKVLK